MSQWTNYFAHPQLLWLMPLLLLAWAVALWARRRRRRAMHQLGRAGAVHKLLLVEPGARRRRAWCLFIALPLLLIGSAGPRWGRDETKEAIRGHDIAVVLDVSQSMLAEQPSREDRALRALFDLADHLEKRGGPRIALIVFAAQPYLMFPLTHDYDHFRHALANIEAGDLPLEIRAPADNPPPSGTRIGAALRLAVKSFDAEGSSPRAVLLLSDGDDPESADKEWLLGVQDARAAHIPIHVVGIGDPDRDNAIFVNGEFLRFQDKIIKTRLDETILQEIAQRTGGSYVPAQTSNVPLGSLLPNLLKNQASDPDAPSLAELPMLHPRHGWFFWPALCLLALALLLRETRKEQRPAITPAEERPSLPPPRVPIASPALACLAMIVLSLMQLGAASPDEDWIRQANAAAEKNDLDAALALYEKAEPTAADPGLVAFNKAAVLYRLKRYRDAELHYLRCLDDDQAPAVRQAQALFGLGNALLRQAGGKDVATLDRAIDAFTLCIQKNGPKELTTDAEYNLELARWLRLKAGPLPPEPPQSSDPMPKEMKDKHQTRMKDDLPGKPEKQNGSGEPAKDEQGNASESDMGKDKAASKLASSGALQSIPDDDTLKPLPPEDTEAHLRELAERILQERRRDPRRWAPAPARVKDW